MPAPTIRSGSAFTSGIASAGNLTGTATVPATVQPGDSLYLYVVWGQTNSTSRTMSTVPPAPWTALQSQNNSSPPNAHAMSVRYFSTTATAGMAGTTVSFTFSAGTVSDAWAAIIVASPDAVLKQTGYFSASNGATAVAVGSNFVQANWPATSSNMVGISFGAINNQTAGAIPGLTNGNTNTVLGTVSQANAETGGIAAIATTKVPNGSNTAYQVTTNPGYGGFIQTFYLMRAKTGTVTGTGLVGGARGKVGTHKVATGGPTFIGVGKATAKARVVPWFRSSYANYGNGASGGSAIQCSIPADVQDSDVVLFAFGWNGYTSIKSLASEPGGNFVPLVSMANTSGTSYQGVVYCYGAPGTGLANGSVAVSTSATPSSSWVWWAMVVVIKNASLTPANVLQSNWGAFGPASSTTLTGSTVGTDQLGIFFYQANSGSAGSTASTDVFLGPSTTNYVGISGSGNAVRSSNGSAYSLGYLAGYATSGNNSYGISANRTFRGGVGVSLNFQAPPKTVVGYGGTIAGTATAKATRGKKGLTATRKGSVLGIATAKAQRGTMTQPIAKSGRGSVTTTATARASGYKNIARTSRPQIAIALVNARRGTKSDPNVRSGQAAFSTTAVVRARGAKNAFSRGRLITTGTATALAGSEGETGLGYIRTTATLHDGHGSRLASGRGRITATGYVQATAGTGAHAGPAAITAVVAAAARAGTAEIIPIDLAGWGRIVTTAALSSRGTGEHTGQGEAVTTAQALAEQGVFYVRPHHARLYVTPALFASGEPGRISRAALLITAGTEVLGYHLPEPALAVTHHVSMVIAAGQGYLPPGTRLAQDLSGKLVVVEPEENHIVELLSGLTSGSADLRITGSYQAGEIALNVYVCTANPVGV